MEAGPMPDGTREASPTVFDPAPFPGLETF